MDEFWFFIKNVYPGIINTLLLFASLCFVNLFEFLELIEIKSNNKKNTTFKAWNVNLCGDFGPHTELVCSRKQVQTTKYILFSCAAHNSRLLVHRQSKHVVKQWWIRLYHNRFWKFLKRLILIWKEVRKQFLQYADY